MFDFILTLIRKRRELKRNKSLSRAELEAVKLNKFRRLVKYVQQHSPYYADIIRQRSIDIEHCRPQDFPVLTKTILMENFDRIITAPDVNKQVITDFFSRSKDPSELLFNKYLVIHTSGSSGEVGYFIYSKADWAKTMAQGMRQGADRPKIKRKRKGKLRMAYFAAIDGHFAGVSMAASIRRGIFKWFMDLGLYDVNDPLPKVVDELNEFQPDFLSGYTTALKILAEKQMSGELRIEPVMIGTGGEALTEADREVLSKAFSCDVSGGYGCSEHLMMGGTKYNSTDMVLYDDDLIYEFFEDHTLVTNLFNYTLPLIRYRMSDIIQPIAGDKSDEPYITIRGLVGRSEIIPTFINRDREQDYINAITIVELFVAGITRFQMHLLSKTQFIFKVCLAPELSEQAGQAAVAAMRQRLQEILNQKLMDNVQFDVEVVADLPVHPKTGKFKLIVDASQGT